MFRFAFVVILIGSAAFGKLVEVQEILAESMMPQWTTSFAENFQPDEAGYSECAGVLELPGAYLCQSMKKETMNQALARASIYVEGLFGTEREVVALDSPIYEIGIEALAGHDLKGQDLARFYSELESQCSEAQDSNICPNTFEREWFEGFILPRIEENPNFVVITFAVESDISAEDVVTHEILHAQYFLDPIYRDVCDRFWEENVSREDQRRIRGILGRFYDSGDALLIRNEFQAYILMAGADQHMLSAYVDKFRTPLLERLRERGVSPLQVAF